MELATRSLIKECFSQLIQWHISKIKKRQQLITATIFRYKYLMRKVFKSILLQKTIYLKKKVFYGLYLVHARQQDKLIEFWEQRKLILFQKFISIIKQMRKQRIVQDAVDEFYQSRLIVRSMTNWRKAVKNVKKLKSFCNQCEFKKKQLFFDKWALALQNLQLQEQLYLDSYEYYQEQLLKRYFCQWKYYIIQRKENKLRLNQLQQMFGQWRNITQNAVYKRECKFKPLYVKYTKVTIFKAWKEVIIDNQRRQLADEFFLFKKLTKWKQFTQESKQMKEKLVDKELILTLKIMEKSKLKYFKAFRNAYLKSIERKGLVKIILQTKLKQNRLDKIKKGFKAFKYTWLIKHFREMKTIQRQIAIFHHLKRKSKIKKLREQQIMLFKKEQNYGIFTKFLKALRIIQQEKQVKEEKASNFYNKKLLRDYLHIFITGIIIQHEEKNQLSLEFYRKRKLIFCFNALHDNIYQKQHQFTINLRLDKLKGIKKFRMLKKCFIILRNNVHNQ